MCLTEITEASFIYCQSPKMDASDGNSIKWFSNVLTSGIIRNVVASQTTEAARSALKILVSRFTGLALIQYKNSRKKTFHETGMEFVVFKDFHLTFEVHWPSIF